MVVVVHPIYYGNVNYKSQLDNYYNVVTKSPWMDLMGQYRIGRGSGVPGITFTPKSNRLDDEKDIQPWLYSLVQSGQIKPTLNTYYPVHLQAGIVATAWVVGPHVSKFVDTTSTLTFPP
ncbi:UNVERIFIED_CONTAM: hypothetical protein HDU68_002129 [Siphonaria sp. JEL0065]|nr:hypothetical protein HDU68_002129 [Siphonaria sp. JEL0065]